jgi:hypothetical protein
MYHDFLARVLNFYDQNLRETVLGCLLLPFKLKFKRKQYDFKHIVHFGHG